MKLSEITEEYIGSLETQKEVYQVQKTILELQVLNKEKEISLLQKNIRSLEEINRKLEDRMKIMEVTQ